jgi:Lon protease-like protein
MSTRATFTKSATSAKSLPANPNLANLKKRAKQLVRAHRAGNIEALDPRAAVEPPVQSSKLRQVARDPFSLCEAQLMLARQYGFSSWPKLSQHIEAIALDPSSESAEATIPGEIPEAFSGGVPFVLPMLPIRDVVAFPGMRLPLYIGRSKSMRGVDRARNEGGWLFLGTQRERQVEEPSREDLYEIGTLAKIESVERPNPDVIQVVMTVRNRARLEDFIDSDIFAARVSGLPTEDPQTDEVTLMQQVVRNFSRYAEQTERVSPEMVDVAERASLPGRLADSVAAGLVAPTSVKQSMLECLSPDDRLLSVSNWLNENIR